jgi:hypothetical protein
MLRVPEAGSTVVSTWAVEQSRSGGHSSPNGRFGDSESPHNGYDNRAKNSVSGNDRFELKFHHSEGNRLPCAGVFAAGPEGGKIASRGTSPSTRPDARGDATSKLSKNCNACVLPWLPSGIRRGPSPKWCDLVPLDAYFVVILSVVAWRLVLAELSWKWRVSRSA